MLEFFEHFNIRSTQFHQKYQENLFYFRRTYVMEALESFS